MRIATISVHGCPCIQPGGIDAGGMNVYVDQVSERLARLGNSVHVYSRSHQGMECGDDRRGYNLIHVPVGEADMPKGELPDILHQFAETVAQDVSQKGSSYDILTSHYWLSGVAGCELARIWETPHVTSFHTLASIKKRVRPEEEEPEVRFINEQSVALNADVVVAWTQEEVEHISAEFGLPKANAAVIPPGVDTDFFSPAHKSTTSQDRTRILYVGRLDALKGVDLLIEVLASLVSHGMNAELQIVGGGSADEFRRVLGRISELRLTDRVKLPGVLPQSALPKIYSEADCIVAPSFHETFGLAVLEAASCGTPAVAADVGGLRSIVVNGKSGFLIRQRDPKLYAEAILKIIASEKLYKSMSKTAREHAENMSWDSAVKGLIDVYNRILKTTDSHTATQTPPGQTIF